MKKRILSILLLDVYKRQVLDHDGKYAACMVTLSQGVREDD